jgi:hypothetical protein
LSKKKGTLREYKARDQLYDDGALLVVRSAGSQGPVDLVAVFKTHVLLIQVKSDKYSLSKKDRVTLSILARLPFIKVEHWLYQYRKPFLIEEIGGREGL